MAEVKLANRLGGKAAKLQVVRTKPKVELPMVPQEAGGDLEDFSFLIHGQKKIGKTSLALSTEKGFALLLQFDPPQKSYRRLEVVCNDYPTFMEALRQLEGLAANKFPYPRVVVDRVDLLYRRCFSWVCMKLGIEHPADEGWGGAWDKIRWEFTETINRVLRLPCGRWFLCHSSPKETEDRHGRKIQQLLPNLPGQAEDVLTGLVDGWFSYDWDEDQRVLIPEGSARIGAGHRIDQHFKTPDGQRVKSIPMGSNVEEARAALLRAFNNKQATPTGESKRVVVPVKKIVIAKR